MSTAIASFHLVRERPGRGLLALVRLGTDRRPLRSVEGLTFHRLLGTGRGRDTRPSVDLRRTALFARWEDDAALDAFLASSPVADRWAGAEEAYTVRLRLLAGHGRWRGIAVLDDLATGRAGGPVAVLTRAHVRLRRWPRFWAATGPVAHQLAATPGLLAVAAVGEAPVGRQGTFSLWRSAADVDAFLAHHADVVHRTRTEGWYGEELFARFEPYAPVGTWGGVDPLAGSPAPAARALGGRASNGKSIP